MRNAKCGVKIVRMPLGWTGVVLSENGIISIILPKNSKAAVVRELEQVKCSNQTGRAAEGLLAKAVKQVESYFSGQAVTFDLPLDLGVSTTFQRAVWNAAAEIPYGETRSYGWIAKRVGKPKAARAVGQAMGANPVPLLVP